MLSFSSTIGRFTPPTCTLEIKARRSPLARWTKKNLLKNLRFQLSFDDPRVATEQQVTIQGDRQQLEQLYTAAIDYTQRFLTSSFQNNQLKSVTDPTQPHFQPQGLVRHQLFLGSLATKDTVEQIELSAVQLFDLVTVLEAYNSQIANLPNLTTYQPQRSIPLWGSIAASSLLLVGLTAGGIKLWQLSATKEDNLVTARNSTPSAPIPKLDEVKPPDISASKSQPTPQPRLTEPLSSTNKLPPPPAVDLPKPQPDIPDPAQYPLPEVAQKSGFSLPKPTPNNEQLSQTESTINISPQPGESVSVPKQETKQETPIATISPFDRSTTALKPEDFMPEKIDSNLERELKAREKFLESNQSAAEIESLKSEVDRDVLENSGETEAVQNKPNSDLPTEKPQSEINKEQEIALNSPTAPNTQLQEITAYFQQKWQPPAKLSQSLEYRLLLNPDGSLQRVIPLGKVSEIYLDRTNIPLRGEAFISPFPEEQKSTIRLLLSPDGEVTAFAE